jgi:hypothetical protein
VIDVLKIDLENFLHMIIRSRGVTHPVLQDLNMEIARANGMRAATVDHNVKTQKDSPPQSSEPVSKKSVRKLDG